MKEYAVYMQWNSYDGSLFVETHTSWYYVSSKDEANQKAKNQYGHHKGFKITG